MPPGYVMYLREDCSRETMHSKFVPTCSVKKKNPLLVVLFRMKLKKDQVVVFLPTVLGSDLHCVDWLLVI